MLPKTRSETRKEKETWVELFITVLYYCSTKLSGHFGAKLARGVLSLALSHFHSRFPYIHRRAHSHVSFAHCTTKEAGEGTMYVHIRTYSTERRSGTAVLVVRDIFFLTPTKRRRERCITVTLGYTTRDTRNRGNDREKSFVSPARKTFFFFFLHFRRWLVSRTLDAKGVHPGGFRLTSSKRNKSFLALGQIPYERRKLMLQGAFVAVNR